MRHWHDGESFCKGIDWKWRGIYHIYIYRYYIIFIYIYISYILSISISISICHGNLEIKKDLEIFDAVEWAFSKGNRDLNAAFLGIWTSIFISMEDWFFISKYWIHHDLSISHKSVSPKTWDTPRVPDWENYGQTMFSGMKCWDTLFPDWAM